MPRKTVTLTEPMATKISYYAKTWKVSEAEVLRLLFGLGDILAEKVEQGHELFTIDPKTNEQIRYKIPNFMIPLTEIT